MTRTISITSGKGGVGKSTVTANLACVLSEQGKRVLILDGDFGMANIDIMFGVRPQGTIADVLHGEATLQEILIEVEPGVHLISGGSGIVGMQNLNDFQKKAILDQVAQLPNSYDYMLIDTAPGIDTNVLYLNSAAQEICLILTPDPSSMADSYALIKVLNKYHREDRFKIICNQVRDEVEATLLFRRLSDVVSRFLVVSLDYGGFIPQDPILGRATKSQQLVVRTHPYAPSSQAIRALARNLSGIKHFDLTKGGVQFFWEQLVGVA